MKMERSKVDDGADGLIVDRAYCSPGRLTTKSTGPSHVALSVTEVRVAKMCTEIGKNVKSGSPAALV